jgi:hypothetical protein
MSKIDVVNGDTMRLKSDLDVILRICFQTLLRLGYEPIEPPSTEITSFGGVVRVGIALMLSLDVDHG